MPRRPLRPLAVAIGVLALVVTATAPASAVVRAPVTGVGTSLTFSGSGGDYITEDRTYAFRPPATEFTVSTDPEGGRLTLSVVKGDHESSWNLRIQAPPGERFTAGRTYRTTRFGEGGTAALDLSGDGRGCNATTGSISVREARFGTAGWVERFSADFVQHCEGGPAAATGSVVLRNGRAPGPLRIRTTPDARTPLAGAGEEQDVSGWVTCTQRTPARTGVVIVATLRQRGADGVDREAPVQSGPVRCGPTPVRWTANGVADAGFRPGTAQIEGVAGGTDVLTGEPVSAAFSGSTRLG